MASLRKATGLATALKPRPSLAQPCLLLSAAASPASHVRWFGVDKHEMRTGRRRGGRRRRGGMATTLGAFFLTGAGLYAYTSYTTNDSASAQAKAKPKTKTKDGLEEGQYSLVIPKAEIEFEPTVTPQGPDGDIRDALSPQHRQIKHSVEHPGVYAWGSNAGRVVAPDSADANIREPRRIKFFDGQVLRDLKLDQDVGVAVTEGGDVVQWGIGFWGQDAVPSAPIWAKLVKDSKAAKAAPPTVSLEPAVTLKGKKIVKVALSNDRVIALGSNGTVYSIPMSMKDLNIKATPISSTSSSSSSSSSSWLWSSAPATDLASSGIRTVMTPTGLGWGERVVDIRSGQEHCLMMTSKGRVFAAVASFSSFPARGQLGVPGLTWETRSKDKPLDAAYEVPGLKGVTAAQIATGDYHSLVLARHHNSGGADSTGLYSFGDNSTGQLCVPASLGMQYTASPIEVPVQKLYEPVSDGTPLGNNNVALQRQDRPATRVTSIAAGGATSFFTVDVIPKAFPQKVLADTWSCGSGIYGTLGTGKWVHISTAGPSKIRALSGLAEYSEAAQAVVPIRLAHIEAGATHAMAVLQNATHMAASRKKARSDDTNWGSDTLWWGGNEYYQLGTGKRSNQSEPVHIAPLDAVTVTGPAAKNQLALEPLAAKAPVQQAGVTTNLDLTRERLSLTPKTSVRLADGHKVNMEQRATCGRYVSGVYSGV
ncbi:rrna processing protein [Ophiostoma piceae UAMH 11346]|uniref:Rrna processing protein n=1 Tax=Ophiostoma piceae (strain UAMH 11346) TaxID=1262450 RepID=S3CRP4_OPHP1|nr:rrna processing protein [Ophiostoma piceae UAMH 11346]